MKVPQDGGVPKLLGRERSLGPQGAPICAVCGSIMEKVPIGWRCPNCRERLLHRGARPC